jgi:hypothetical protein
MLHDAKVRVATPSAPTTKMMITKSDRHTTLRWVAEPTLLNEWFTGSSAKNHVLGSDQRSPALNNGRPNCENIDWLSS